MGNESHTIITLLSYKSVLSSLIFQGNTIYNYLTLKGGYNI